MKVTQSNPGLAPAGQKDKLLTDLGLFQIATEGVPVGTTAALVGELWVTYQVKLSRATIVRSIALREAEWFAAEWTITHNGAGLPTYTAIGEQAASTFTPIITIAGTPTFNRINVEFPSTTTSGTYAIRYTISTVLGASVAQTVFANNCRLARPWSVVGDRYGAQLPIALGDVTLDVLDSNTGAVRVVTFYMNFDGNERDPTSPTAFNIGYTSGTFGAAGNGSVSVWQVPTRMAELTPSFQT